MFWLLYPSGKKRSKFYFSAHILDSYLLLITFISELPHPSQQIIVERSVIRSSKWLGEIFKLGALVFSSLAIISFGIYISLILSNRKILVITTTKTVIGAIGYPRKKEGWYPHAQFLPAAPQNCRAFPVLSCSYFICLVKCHFISSYQSHFRSQVISTQTFHISYRLDVQDH